MAATNQAMVLTAAGAGAIAVVRLVGPGVQEFLKRRFSQTVSIGACVHGVLRDGNRVIDDPVVVWCAADVADLNVHGGTWVVQTVLELAKGDGFEIVRGEKEKPLPEKAVDGTTEIWREVMQWLPRARTELAVRMLLAQPAAWEKLEGRMRKKQPGVAGDIELALTDRRLEWLLGQPRVAIVGAPNVGKSTLANQLFGEEKSITADVAGTTRDWIGEMANIDGLAVMLVDTPGRRETADIIERMAIAAAGEQVETADLVVLVLDRSREISEEERGLLDLFDDAVVVANKADCAAAWRAESIHAIEVVATTGMGMGTVRQEICRRFGCESFEVERARVWTERQRSLLEHWGA